MSREPTVHELQSALTEERAIVSRIWALFGNPTYKDLGGRSIYDLVQAAIDAKPLHTKIAELHEQLTDAKEALIKIVSMTGSQPMAMNMPDADWYKGRFYDAIGIAARATAEQARSREDLAKMIDGIDPLVLAQTGIV